MTEKIGHQSRTVEEHQFQIPLEMVRKQIIAWTAQMLRGHPKLNNVMPKDMEIRVDMPEDLSKLGHRGDYLYATATVTKLD